MSSVRVNAAGEVVITIEEQSENNHSFDRLPNELVAYLFSHLKPLDIAHMSQVCQHFFAIVLRLSNYINFSENREIVYFMLENQDLSVLRHSIQNISMFAASKECQQLSPYKLHNFFAREKYLLDPREEDTSKNRQFSKSTKKRAVQLLFSAVMASTIPLFIGYLSGNNSILFLSVLISMVLSLTKFSRGLCKLGQVEMKSQQYRS